VRAAWRRSALRHASAIQVTVLGCPAVAIPSCRQQSPAGKPRPPPPAGNQPARQNPKSFRIDHIEPGYNQRTCVVAGDVITTRHRNIALLVAGCFFMEMLDGTNIMVS
jgi:hypothetical protein